MEPPGGTHTTTDLYSKLSADPTIFAKLRIKSEKAVSHKSSTLFERIQNTIRDSNSLSKLKAYIAKKFKKSTVRNQCVLQRTLSTFACRDCRVYFVLCALLWRFAFLCFVRGALCAATPASPR